MKEDNDNSKDFLRVVARLKGRNLKINDAMRFEKASYLSYFNSAIKDIERRRNKNFTNKEYAMLLKKFSTDDGFLENCIQYEEDKNDSLTKPKMTFGKDKTYDLLERYSVRNIISAEIKNKKDTTFKQKDDKYLLIHVSMSDSPGYKFLKTFEDVEKLRFLLKSLSLKNQEGKVILNKEEKMSFLKKFYNDSNFNFLYVRYIRRKRKISKPILSRKVSIKNGGDNSLDNLHFISLLEFRAKGEMEWKDWKEIKKRIKLFLLNENDSFEN